MRVKQRGRNVEGFIPKSANGQKVHVMTDQSLKALESDLTSLTTTHELASSTLESETAHRERLQAQLALANTRTQEATTMHASALVSASKATHRADDLELRNIELSRRLALRERHSVASETLDKCRNALMRQCLKTWMARWEVRSQMIVL
jgi:hypothetical protein